VINKTIPFSALLIFLFAGCGGNSESLQPEKAETVEQTIQELKIENILRESLALGEGIEVVMSYVEIPKGTTLPFHYHPGEEFAYILESSGELLLADETKIHM
jgi:quercetin dioxygenase-like cupin family protein